MTKPKSEILKPLAASALLSLAAGIMLTSAVLRANPPASKPEVKGLHIDGDPRTGSVKWTYKGVDNGIEYDISGYIQVPEASYGAGPFPAMIVTHGSNQRAAGIVANFSNIARHWGGGVVVIGASMTHATPPDNAGKPNEGRGACEANLLRAAKCLDILAQFNKEKHGFSVNMNKVAAYGFSMGGSLTTMLLGDPRTAEKFYMGAIAGSGEGSTGVTKEMVRGIKAPLLILHGNDDTTDGGKNTPAGKRSVRAEKMIETLGGTTIKFSSGNSLRPEANKGVDFDKTYNWKTRPLPELFERDPKRYTLVSKGTNDKFRLIIYDTGQHVSIAAPAGTYLIPAFKDWVLRTGFLGYLDRPPPSGQ